MKNIFLSLLCSLIITVAYSQKDKKNYEEAFKLVEVWLEAQKDFDELPGISAVVVEDQEVLWSGAFGLSNIEKNVKTETTTICSICSISKLFTSVAIMKLYEEGKLRLDDTIKDLLPAYTLKQQFSESGPITIRSIMTHSAGLPREAGYPYWTGPDFPFPTKEQIDAALNNQETLYPASTYFQYSNLGLSLLGEVITEISGMPYETYIQQNILEPLGLLDTKTVLPEGLYGTNLAIGYSSKTRKGVRNKVKLFQAKGIAPAAGFSSNVMDLGKFASWQFRLRDTTVAEILKPATLKYMHNVHWTDPNWETTWGLGFSVYKGSNGNTWVGHGGSCPGYRSTLQLDLKNKRAFSVMINASGTSPSKYAKGIGAIINKASAPKDKTSSDDTAKKINLHDYVGYYSQQPWWGEMYISTWNDKLVAISLPAENPGKSIRFYKHIKGDVFRRIRKNDALGETIVFERDKNAKVYRYKRNENYSLKIK